MNKYFVIIIALLIAIGAGHILDLQQLMIGGLVILLCTIGVLIGQNIKYKSNIKLTKREISNIIVSSIISFLIFIFGLFYKDGQFLILALIINLLCLIVIFFKIRRKIIHQSNIRN